MKKRLLVLVLLSLIGCRPTPPPEASAVKADEPAASGDCACENLQCWADASAKGSAKQLDCATDTIATIVPVLGPIKDIIKTIIAADSALSAVKDVNNVAKEVLAATERGGIYTPCVKNLVSMSGAAMSTLDGFRKLDEDLKKMTPEDSITKAGPFLKDTFDILSNAIKGITSLFEAMAACETPASKAALREHSAKLAAVKAKAVGPMKSLMKPLEDMTKGAAAKLAVIGTIAKCVSGIADGATTLYKNSACLVKDFDRLAEQRVEISRALGFVGSRMFNQAKYIGCTECVGNHGTFNTAETNYKTCRSLCEQKSGNYVGDDQPKKKSSWTTSCQLTCGIARTEGIVTTYTDTSVCNDVKNMFSVSRTFRHIDLAGSGEGDRKQRVAETRAVVLKHLAVLEQNFGTYDNAANASAGNDGLVALVDLKAAGGNETLSEEARLTAHFFSDSDYWFNLVEAASTEGAADGAIGGVDIGYFRDEVSEYRDETEFE